VLRKDLAARPDVRRSDGANSADRPSVRVKDMAQDLPAGLNCARKCRKWRETIRLE